MDTKTKRWIGIIVALVLLLGGFYLYYFYPQIIPGFAGQSPEFEEDIKILLVGLDDRKSVQKGEVEADSIILATLKGNGKDISIKAIPSNIQIEDKKIKEFKVQNMPEKIERITNIKPDYYVSMSYEGFQEIINKLGGIKINLEQEMKIPELVLDLKKGENILSGKEALNYARWYDYSKDERDRLKRHKKIIEALIDKVFQKRTLLDFSQLYSTIVETYKSVETNMDQELVSRIINAAKNREKMNIDYQIIKKESQSN